MTRDEFLASIRSQSPAFASFSDDVILQSSRFDPRFDPTWIAPAAPVAPTAPELPAAPEPVSLLRRAGDVGAAVIGGAAAVGEGIDTVAQLVTRQPEFAPVQSIFELPGRVAALGVEAAQGRGAEALSSFFAAPEVTGSDFAESLKSAAVSRAKTERQRAIADAEPLFGFQQLGEGAAFVRETLTSPTLLIDLLAQTGAQLIPSALAARGAAVAGGALTTQGGRLARFGTWLASEKGTTAAGLVTGALQQGASVAGDSIADLTAGLAAMDPAEVAEIPQIAALMDNGYTMDQAKAALVLNQATKAGIVSTAASLASGAAFGQPLQQALGRWVNRAPRQVAQTSPGLGEQVVSAARAGAAEGAQEVIEEVSGVVAGNYFSRPVFPDQELFENAGIAGAGGLLGGFMVGGGMSAAGSVADSLARAEAAQPRGQQVEGERPAPAEAAAETTPVAQTPQERFVSFDVEAPTVEQPYFVASVDAFDPRAGGTVGVAFLGRTAEEAAAKRRAAGFEPIENLSPAQQVELVNRIRQAVPQQPVDLVANAARLEETFDAETLSTLRRAKVPDDVLVRLAPEAVTELSKSIRNAGATAEAHRQARVAAQAILAESVAGQPVLPGTEEAVLATDVPAIGAIDTSQPQLPTAEPRGQMRLPFPTGAQVRREEAAARREADLPAAELERELRQDVRARATAARLGSRSIERGLNRIVREEARGQGSTELQTTPLTPGAQQPQAEAPLVAPATEPVAPPPAPQPPSTMPATVAPGAALPQPPAPREVRTTGDTVLRPEGRRSVLLGAINLADVATNPVQDTIADTPAVGTAVRPQILLVFQEADGNQVAVPVAVRSDKRGGVATPRAVLSTMTAKQATDAVVALKRPGWGSRTVAAAIGLEDPRTATPTQQAILEAAEELGYNRWNNKSVETYAIAQGWAFTQRRLRMANAVTPGLKRAPSAQEIADAKNLREATSQVTVAPQAAPDVELPAAVERAMDSLFAYLEAEGTLSSELFAFDAAVDQPDAARIQAEVAASLIDRAMSEFAPRGRQAVERHNLARGYLDGLRERSPEQFSRTALEAVTQARAAMDQAPRGAEVFETQRPLTEAEDAFIESTKPAYTRPMLDNLIRSANMFGFNFTLADMQAALGGRATGNTALLFGAYLDNPNVQTFIAAGHEVAHLFLNRARPAVRLAMHKGIEQLGLRMAGRRDVDPRVGAGSYEQYLATNPANPLTPEQWAAEVVVETAAINGVDRELARGIFAALWRRLKAMMLDLQLWMQEQLFGPEGVNEETARAWLQTQVDSVIAGDGYALGPYLAQFSPRPTIGQRIRMLTPNSAGWRAQFADPVTGVVTSMPVIGVDPTNVDEALRAVVSMVEAQSVRTGRVFRKDNLEKLPEQVLENTERPAPSVQREDGTTAARKIKEEVQAKLAAIQEMKLPFLAGFNARNASVPELTEDQKRFLRSQGESFVERFPDTPEGYKAYANEIGIRDPFSAEKYLVQSATRRLEDELGGELPANFFDVTQRVRDLKNVPTFDLALEEATTAAHTAHNRVRMREQRLKQDVETFSAEIEKLNRKGNRMVKNPLDWTVVQNETVKALREYINEIRDNTERIADASGAASGAAATFSALIDESERNLVAQEALDRVFDEINLDVAQADGGDTTSFYAVMGAFYRLMLEKGINVAASNARELRKTITEEVARDPESALRVFTRKGKTGSIQGTALLAATIDFAKREGQLSEVVRDHAVRTNADAAQKETIDRALREFQEVLLNATEESIASLRVKAQTNRHIQQFLNGRDALDKAKAKLVKAEFALKATRSAREMYSQVAKRADDSINLHTGWHVAHDAPFVMPRSATESIDEMFNRTRESVGRGSGEFKLRLYGDNAMTRAQLMEIADAGEQWLKATEGDPKQIGHKRNLLRIMVQEIKLHANNKFANEMVTALFGVQWRSMEFQLKAAGTEGGAEAARLVQQRDAIVSKYNLEWSARVARKWQTAQQNLQRQSGLTVDEVEQRFFWPMTSLANINMVKDREGFLQAMSAEFAADPVLADIWSRPSVKRAFAEYVEAYAQKEASMDAMQREVEAAAVETQLDVIDPLTGEKTKALRRRIERGEITGVTETPKELRDWVSLANSDPRRAQALFSGLSRARLFNERADLEPLVNEFLGASGWDLFMRPLLANPLGGVPAPRGRDGARRTLPTTETRELADNANENFFNFVEAAYAGRDTEQSLEEYTSDVLTYVGKIWGQLVNEVGRNTAEQESGNPQMLKLARYGIDSRAMRNWPPEWRVGKTGFETEIRSTVESIATAAAIGPNAERWNAAISRHKQELEAKRSRVQEKMNAILAQQPDNLTKKAKIERLRGDTKKEYRRLEKELRQIDEYDSINWHAELMRILNKEQSWMTNNTWAMELWGSALAGLVSGLRSALKNPVALLMVPTIGRELSPFSAVAGARAAKNLGLLLSISFAQITGARPGKGIRTLRALHSTVGVDPANQRKIIDAWTAPDRGVRGNVQGLALLLRRLRTTFSDARVGFSYQGLAPSLRLFNPFAWMQYLTTAASQMTLIDTYEDIVTKLADFEARGGNISEPYTADDIGFSGSTTELTNWVNQFNSIGSIEVAVRQMQELNRKGDYDNVPEMIVSTAARIGVDYVSGESSVSGNPLVFTQSTGGRVASALVGWSVRQADKMLRIFTNPQNGRDAKAFTNGLVLFSIGLLPPILAYSAFLDWTDEVTDRKRNKLPLTQAEGPEQTMKAVLESVSDVGFAGAGFDIAASVVNPQQALSGAGDIFSVDNKIVAVSLVKSFAEAVKNAVAVGPKNWTWTGTGREFAQAFGAAGPMGNFELLNRVTGEWATGLPLVGGIFDSETSRVMRMDAVNNVRSAARGVGLDVRSYSGGSYIPRPWNGHVTNMIYAALRDDRTSFREHYDKAVESARGVAPRGDERDAVARAFEARHVWRQTKTPPAPAEIKLMLDVMTPDGREAVLRASDLMNRYGATIGAKPFTGARSDTPAAAERAAARRQGMTVEEFRRNRAGF